MPLPSGAEVVVVVAVREAVVAGCRWVREAASAREAVVELPAVEVRCR